MSFHTLAKAVSLPLLAGICLSASALLGLLSSGSTRVEMTFVGDSRSVNATLEQAKFLGSVKVLRAGESALAFESGCANGSTVLIDLLPEFSSGQIEQLIESAGGEGATLCEGPTYQFNQAASFESSVSGFGFGWQWTLALLLTSAVVLGIYRRYGPVRDQANLSVRPAGAIMIGLAAAVLLYGIRALILARLHLDGGAPAVVGEGSGVGAPFVLASVGILVPIVEEVAFRAWLIPIASRVIGLVGAVALSVALFVAGHLVLEPSVALFYLGAGMIFSMVWCMTRSLMGCFAAHGTYNVLVFLIP
jgi:membrane protease YdiL (CAAX protease family)